MAGVIRTTDLDFDAIKEELKTYLKNSEDFADYNFEASGLSSILDVLAHNTHMQGLIANYAINESFLSSAQLRSSVVSHASSLGYDTTSKTAATATVKLTVSTNLTSPSTISLPAFSAFSTVVDGITYQFLTTQQYVGYNDGNGLYTFQTIDGLTSIEIKGGTQKQKNFLVGEDTDDQIYVIPDYDCDTTTIQAKLFISPSSQVYYAYNNVKDVVRVTSDSRIFLVKEAPNGFYELQFSDGNVLGISPKSGEKIQLDYIAASGEGPNGANAFTYNDVINIADNDYTLTVTTLSVAAGGAERESISSIKRNAPVVFSAQQRLITPDDYVALIKERFSSTIDNVAAWGGNDNIPPQYGKVFVSLDWKDGLTETVKDNVKGSIVTSLTDNLAVMSISTEIVDPEYTYLELGCDFNFDPDLTSDTLQSIERQIINTMQSYVTNNLSTFDGVFRRSNLLTEIDALSESILDTKMEVKIQQRFVPSITDRKTYKLNFPVAIAPPDDEDLQIVSSRFQYLGQDCNFRNRLKSETLQIVNINDDVVIDNIGNYNQSSGTINITNFLPESFVGDYISVSVFPANQATVRPLRNYILLLDAGKSFAKAAIDYQNTRVVLT